jgi:uncharacterized Zn finger protein
MTTSKNGFSQRIATNYSAPPDNKVQRYINQFFDCTRMEARIAARVEGNHGTYSVSIWIKDGRLESACSCYIGKHGYCHHCEALAKTFLENPDAFIFIEPKSLIDVQTIDDVADYLRTTTLESLLDQLKTKGITNKAVAQAVGLNPRHLSSMKTSELRNRYHRELGATKLACLWLLDRFG